MCESQFLTKFCQLQMNKGQHDGHSDTPASFSDLNRRIASFQLHINYQIGYNPLITFSAFWQLSFQTTFKKKSAQSGCPSWQLVIQVHTSWLSKKPSCTKILFTVRMRPATIALNYSVESIRNNVRQKIYNGRVY